MQIECEQFKTHTNSEYGIWAGVFAEVGKPKVLALVPAVEDEPEVSEPAPSVELLPDLLSL